MRRIGDWFRKNMTLKMPGESPEITAKDRMHTKEGKIMLEAIESLIKDPRLGLKLRELTFSPEHFAAMVAACYTILRRRDPCWDRLSREKAVQLYVGVAITMLEIAYRTDCTEDAK